jgi:hypothetical protein
MSRCDSKVEASCWGTSGDGVKGLAGYVDGCSMFVHFGGCWVNSLHEFILLPCLFRSSENGGSCSLLRCDVDDLFPVRCYFVADD